MYTFMVSENSLSDRELKKRLMLNKIQYSGEHFQYTRKVLYSFYCKNYDEYLKVIIGLDGDVETCVY